MHIHVHTYTIYLHAYIHAYPHGQEFEGLGLMSILMFMGGSLCPFSLSLTPRWLAFLSSALVPSHDGCRFASLVARVALGKALPPSSDGLKENKHTPIQAFTCTHTQTCTKTYIHLHTPTHIHTNIHAYIHAYAHTHTH